MPFDINADTLLGWLRQADTDSGTRPGLTTSESARIAELERMDRESKRANQLLKPARLSLRRSQATHHEDRESGLHGRAWHIVRAWPICRALEGTPAQIAPSTRTRPQSARAQRDEDLCAAISRIHEANYGVYRVRKIHAEFRREGQRVAESTVRRLMRQLGLRGISRAKGPKTTKPAPETGRPTDLVKQQSVGTESCSPHNSGTKPAAIQLGINPDTLRGWLKQAEIDGGTRPGVTSNEAARIAELEREVRELKRANQILKSASAFFAAELDRPSR